MRLVKLDAIDSTNNFLKDLIRKEQVDNFTVVSADEQTNGRGQMGSVWASEKGKNLIMSILVKDFLIDATLVFDLNMAFSLAVLSVLKRNKIPDVTVKWPNDIMSGNKKIGGILIENSFKSENEILSVVGLGLNVNQKNFNHLPQASSLVLATGLDYDIVELMYEIIIQFKANVTNWSEKKDFFKPEYISSLFKLHQKMLFKKKDDFVFEGSIIGINPIGKLLIQSDDGIFDFDIKEVQMIF
ncbi:biotin--[acetyl-CoA-carboxylase] ligase [Flavobacterium sp. CYK-55]|uniref:biotin--[acetyl-CoA-carboxylase] ligase n=1 Tax=Flavobacterium sp. CYK-55 TaxID=2835529 RepID=UPI001BD1404D|nr:biotin--[acetyl-CoA-carboxylase] ligase [Flavobacterium sp. CYK-55]MBS7787757.1 biotin--[acetyl-CoA-carboxylase] ligase [Flavobacterium sp. CYK-55]